MSRFIVFLAAAMLTDVSYAQEQSADFASGGMHFSAKAMDTNGDAMISKDEFMKYAATHWSLLPRDASGQISVTDLEKAMKQHRKTAAAAAAAAKSD